MNLRARFRALHLRLQQRGRSITGLAVILLAVTPATIGAQANNIVTVDASSHQDASPSSYVGGTSLSPSGHTLGLNSRYLLRDGKPLLPVMGEFHFTRVPETEWEEEILKMKSAGVSIIATYVIWIHHEENEGEFDWSGRRDLHRFVDLCAKHGMLVYVRIGPWSHGEVRNGGFPDWLLSKAPHTRQNDPAYLKYAQRFFQQIGAQVRGKLWKDGGPIVGVQIENEYAARGTGKGEEHVLALKQAALAAGLDVPFYSVTGWDNAVVPRGQAIAVFGGYADAPWSSSLTDLPPQEVYAFRFGSRVTGDMGAIGKRSRSGQSDDTANYDFPFITAEMGGGVEDTYHRRPVLEPDDVAAMMPVMLGSGVNLYGSYMFQGGTNPDGKNSTLQESQRTGYATDVPIKSYDFQAPLGEFGQERPVLRKLKVFNYFLQAFGPDLAPMQTYAPTRRLSSPTDFSMPRVSVRADREGSGFLFFNNYVRNAAMPAREKFQVQIKQSSSELRIPENPITLPAGAYGLWPFGMHIGGAVLRYATAMPFARLQNDGHNLIYFVATPGVPTEFVFEPGASIAVAHARMSKRSDGALVISDIRLSLSPAITLSAPGQPIIEIAVLTQQQAEQSWRIPVDRLDAHLVVTPDELWSDGDRVWLDRNDNPSFSFDISPALARVKDATAPLRVKAGKEFTSVRATVSSSPATVTATQIAEAGTVPEPARLDNKHATVTVPEESAWNAAARWRITVPEADWAHANDLFLTIRYSGDIARLNSADRLLADNFSNGVAWQVGLRRFRETLNTHSLRIADPAGAQRFSGLPGRLCTAECRYRPEGRSSRYTRCATVPTAVHPSASYSKLPGSKVR